MATLPSPFSIHNHLSDWIGATLEIRCACGRCSMPSVLMLLDQWADRTFVDLVARLRCEACNARPRELWLVAGHHRNTLGRAPDWAVPVKGVGVG